MATTSERLAFLLSLNSEEAIRGFQQVGKAADKHLASTEDRLKRTGVQFTKIGAGALAFAGIAGAALFSTTDEASDLNEVVAKTRVIFGDSAEAIEQFGRTAASTLGQSNRAALEAATTFGTLGKAAGLSGVELTSFATDLTTLSSDLASFSNTTPEEAVEALGAALRGEAEPIRRYGVLLDDATLKNRALELGLISTTTGTLPPAIKAQAAYAEILAQTTDAQGDYARTADGAANTQRRLAAEAENAKASIGAALLPVLAGVTGAAADAAGRFTDFNEATGGAAAKAVTFGVAGIGAAGALSFLIGKTLSSIDTFKDLNTRLRDTEGNLTKSGKAVSFFGKSFAALAITEAVGGVFNEITDSAGKQVRALQALVIATEGAANDQIAAFERLAKTVNDDFNPLRDIVGDFGKEIKLAGTDTKRDIEDLDRAFDKLLQTPEQAGEFLDALREQTELLDHNSGQYRDNISLIERYTERLGLQTESTRVMSETTADAATDQGDLAEAVTDTKTAAEEARDEFDRLRDAYALLSDEIDADNAWLDLQGTFDDVQTSAVEAFTAASEHTDDAESKGRDYQRNLNDLRLAVLNYGLEVLNLPPEKLTPIIAAIDRGAVDEAEAALERLARDREVRIMATGPRGPGSSSLGLPSRGFAVGGQMSSAGPALVHRDEVLDLPANTTVHTRDSAEARAARAGGLTIGTLIVGSPSDLPDVRVELDRIAYQMRTGAR